MPRYSAFPTCLGLALVASAALVAAQQSVAPPLPTAPPTQFGSSVTPAFEGWFTNSDGTHSFLIGYYNRNTEAELDVPIGPNNKFGPGNPDMGQPTHFLPRRRYGMFVVTVPKEFSKTQQVTWTLSVNGSTVSIPFQRHTDYEISALKSTEEASNREFNLPPSLRFAESGPAIVGPVGTPTKAVERKAVVGVPMPLDIWTEDDGNYTTGSNTPLSGERPPVTWAVTKYRGPGTVKVDAGMKLAAIKGGKPLEAYAGKGSTTVSFSAPGEYLLHVQLNDYSGQGGRGTGCCWTTAIVRVHVSGAAASGGQ